MNDFQGPPLFFCSAFGRRFSHQERQNQAQDRQEDSRKGGGEDFGKDVQVTDQYYTVNEIAKRWKLNRQTVYGWISMRRFPFEKLGKVVRIPAEPFHQWIRENTEGKL